MKTAPARTQTGGAARKRLGFFGGSFDPVHLGHLLAAQDAWEQMALDRVFFVPAAQAPLRDARPVATAEQRLAMLRAAIGDDARFEIATLELERGGVNYTIDTARELRRSHPADDLFWIIGADQAGRLADWRAIAELAALVEFIVLARPGFAVPQTALPMGVRLHAITAHVCEISSSEIRARLGAGKPVRYFLPDAVADLLTRHQLYRSSVHAH